MTDCRSICSQFNQDCSAAKSQWKATLESWRDEKARKFESRYWSPINQHIDVVATALQDAASSIEESLTKIPG